MKKDDKVICFRKKSKISCAFYTKDENERPKEQKIILIPKKERAKMLRKKKKRKGILAAKNQILNFTEHIQGYHILADIKSLVLYCDSD